MPKGVAPEEAYLLGCLFGRGSIDVTKSKTYNLVFRIPFRECSPVMVDIVNTLLKNPKGLSYQELLELPKVKAQNVVDLRVVLRGLKYWHPPGRMMSRRMIVKDHDKWKIHDPRLCKEFIQWQELYLQREVVSVKDFVLRHLKDATTFIATNPDYMEELSAFGVINHIIKCEITPHAFGVLKSKYGLEEGDIYRHARIPKSVFSFPVEALQEFVRGLADTIATVDLWLGLPRIQFSVINENWQLPVNICAILQTKLRIPVFYIEWAGSYMDRGGRDHLVKVWVINFDKEHFPPPLYYNRRKQEEFLEHLANARKKLGRKRTPMFGFCPVRRKKRDYMNTCMEQDCAQLPKSKKLLDFMIKGGD